MVVAAKRAASVFREHVVPCFAVFLSVIQLSIYICIDGGARKFELARMGADWPTDDGYI